jgi:hypothetical protein
MWIFTTKGFISIVQDRDNPNGFMVRARKKQHLHDIFPTTTIYSVAGSDYKWRARITKQDVALVISQEITDIEYTNFKNAIPDHDYHEACSDVWSVMFNYQRRQE